MADVVSSLSRAGRLLALVPGWVLVLGAFAYRALFLDALHLPASSRFEQWFFTPEQGSPLLPIGIAAWMLVRRRSRLLALPDRGAPAIVSALVAAGVCLFAWAYLAGERSLLLASLAANLLAFAAAARGPFGCRAALLPALVLLLGAPIPAPLRDEIVWRLQVSSAHGATWLMQLLGADAVLQGVVIHSRDYAFTVVETCSGLRGIQILTLVALATRELFSVSGWRSWIVVGIAPWLALALNVLRIAAVAALTGSTGAEASTPESWDHTPQGIAVLVAGTALLYVLAHGLAGAAHPGDPGDGPRAEASEPSGRSPRRAPGAGALVVLALLAIFSLTLAPLPRDSLSPPIELPMEHAGWIGEDLPQNRLFVGQFQPGQVLHRRYQMEMRGRPARVVDLLVGYEAIENPSSHLLSPKLLVPDHDWSLAEARSARLWLLGLDGQLAVAVRDSELALAYLWRLRDEGVWRETWRAALALDVGPLQRERRRAVVRVTTPLANDGPVARDRAKKTLDRFVSDFADELTGL